MSVQQGPHTFAPHYTWVVGENSLLEERVIKIESLYNTRTLAIKNLHSANVNYEKNYMGEKSDAAANNLLTAIRDYEAADNAFNKAVKG